MSKTQFTGTHRKRTSGTISADDTVLVYNVSRQTLEEVDVSDLVGGWRDLRSPLIGAKVPAANAPTLTAFGPTGAIYQNAFVVDDEVYIAFHIDHDIKQGSTIFPHVHWATDGTSENTAKWELTYTLAERTDEPAFPADTVINIEAAANATAWAHQVSEDTVGFDAPAVDSLIIMKVKRITNGGSENADVVFGLFVDLHYEAQQYGTKNRLAPFYE